MDLKISIYNSLNDLMGKNLTAREKYACKRINCECVEDLESLFRQFSHENVVYISSRISLCPILQKGPSCGIAALNMALNYLTPQNPVPFDTMLQECKKLELTGVGECFLVDNLLKLCNFYNLNSKLVSCETKEFMLSSIAKHLLEKKLILIAYDRDVNNEPCFKNGHKAHWGVLTGMLIQCDDGSATQFSSCLATDEVISSLHHQISHSELLEYYLTSSADKSSIVYLMHGWSIHTRCINIDQLVESNWQIRVASPHLDAKYKDMIIPEAGDITNLSKCFISIS